MKLNKTSKLVLTIVSIAILLGLAGTAGYFGYKYYQIKKNPQVVGQEETADLVKKVGKLISLPADETPSVATVTDKEKLKDQPFFAQSENGDKVLIYTKAKKAILYRPSTDRIVEVMPIAFNAEQAAEQQKAAEAPKAEAPKTETKK